MPSGPCRPALERPVRTVAVVGAGVGGLAAAWRLQQQGVDATVIEAGDRVGGQVRTVSFAGRLVEVGAEGLHLASPDTAALLRELGLLDDAIEARSGGTWVEVGGRLRRLPAGVGPAGPTRLWPVVTSGVLSVGGLARAALEPLFAHRRRAGDVAVGDLVAQRFGPQVVDRLVDPLLGGIHAGDVRRLSLRACTPQLVPAVEQGRSLAVRRKPSAPGSAARPPGLVSWDGGLQRLVGALDSRLAAPVALNAAVREVRPDGEGGFVVRHGSDDELLVDAVVLAVPARAASALLGDLAPAAAASLQRIRTSSVATVVAALPRSLLSTHPALAGTGILVPTTSGRLLRAATFLTSKWPQLADTDQLLVRLSAGRSGHDAIDTLPDDELVDALVGDLADVLEVAVAPSATLVRRWPHSMPQQEVGHRELVEGVRRALGGAASRIALAGASYDGVGVAACLRSGELAAERLLAGAAAHVDAGVRA